MAVVVAVVVVVVVGVGVGVAFAVAVGVVVAVSVGVGVAFAVVVGVGVVVGVAVAVGVAMITCDRSNKRHYEEEGRRYFSVSQVCDLITGGHDWADQDAMDRGTALHRLFALTVAAHAGLCPPPIPTPPYVGYHQSIMHWINAANPAPIDIEQRAVSTIKGLPFAGTRDLLYWGHDKGKRLRILLDLKSGQKESWHRIQVQAYGKLCHDADRLALLYIHADGSMPSFQIVTPFTRDWALFQNALSVLIGRETL